MNVIYYEHHGTMVAVREDLKGLHREYCLCHSCVNFKPNTPENCHIAQAVFDNCVEFNITTPMWECPGYDMLLNFTFGPENKI